MVVFIGWTTMVHRGVEESQRRLCSEAKCAFTCGGNDEPRHLARTGGELGEIERTCKWRL